LQEISLLSREITDTQEAAETCHIKRFSVLTLVFSGNNDLHHLQYIPIMASFSYKAHALGGHCPEIVAVILLGGCLQVFADSRKGGDLHEQL